jgi:hypothetical protein
MDSSAQLLQTMNKLKTLGIKPDATLYIRLLTTFANAGDEAKALQYFEQMQTVDGIAADESTYAILIEMCLRLGNMDKTQALMHAMQQQAIPISSKVYYSLFAHAVKQGDANGARRLLTQVVASAKAEKASEAKNSFGFNTAQPATIGSYEWTMVFQCLLEQENRVDSAAMREVFEDMLQCGTAPTAFILSTLAEHALRTDEAARRRVAEERVLSERDVHLPLEGAEEVPKDTAATAWRPSYSHYDYYRHLAEQARSIDDASLKAIKRLAKEGLANPTDCLTRLLALYGSFATLDDLQLACNTMDDMGVVSDLETMASMNPFTFSLFIHFISFGCPVSYPHSQA